MKKTFIFRGIGWLVLGLALTGVSCRSPLISRAPADTEIPAPPPVAFTTPSEKDQPPAPAATDPVVNVVAKVDGPVQAEEAGGRALGPSSAETLNSDSQDPAPIKKTSWFKRILKRADPVPEAVAEPVVQPAPAPATQPATANPVEPAVKPAPAPASEAVEQPAVVKDPSVQPEKKPWFKFWSKKPAAPQTEEEAKLIAAADKAPELPPPSAIFSASGEPLIKAGYKLRVSVSAGGKMEIPEQVKTVSGDGEINLPLAGSFKCEGLTLKQAGDKLESLFEQYIRDPQASVDFIYEGRAGELSPWGSVVIWGWVRQPGSVNIPPTRDLTLSSAIQLAGGLKESANEEKILITRRRADGSVERIFVDLVEVAKRGVSEKDLVLQHGDRVYVEQTVW